MPSSTYIDLKNQTKRRFSVISSVGVAVAWQPPGNEMPPAYTRQPNEHPNRLVIASEGAAVARQSPGREDLLAYTDEKTFPWGISPLRSDCRPHSGRNDSIKTNEHDVISSVSREIPRKRNDNKRTQIPPILARAGSAHRADSSPRNPLRKKRYVTYPRQPNAGGGSPSRNSLR